MECEMCLTDHNGKPAFSDGVLHGLAPDSSSFAANTLLYIGTYQVWKKTPSNKILSVKRHAWQSEDVNMFGDHTLSPESSKFMAQTELYVAHITARLPLLTIVGADVSLPRVTKIEGEGALEQPVTSITLEVRWDRTISVLAAILGVVIFLSRVSLSPH
ncbi:hypothetical protein B0H67DRAFT_261603 [Lasiosphaeris hirsuta]|uniref:Uncharacterized protein n=1 Tax=Lasiosphaeris hirsuta TaxID=260670 RepID=A0AA40AIC9_9PEZI|nr:hypothetical protein B0H67DRAFT_261603 [Lasiosphaeris hirsuta]